MKTCSISYVIRELKVKTIIKYQYTPIKMVNIQNTDNTKCWQGCRATRTSFITGGNAKATSALGDSLTVSYKTEYTLTIQ